MPPGEPGVDKRVLLRGCPFVWVTYQEGGMTHIARPASERMPNTKTTTPMVIFAGRLGHSTSVSYSTVSIGSLFGPGFGPNLKEEEIGADAGHGVAGKSRGGPARPLGKHELYQSGEVAGLPRLRQLPNR